MTETTNGYVKLYRKLRQWGWYSDSVVKDVFIHLLIIATWREGQYMGLDLHPGDAIIGRRALAQELGFSEQQVRTALKKLESTGEILQKSTNRFTLVTVVNWAFYQGEDEEGNKRITNEQPTDNQRITNNQPHLKKVRNKESNNTPYNPPQWGSEVVAIVDHLNQVIGSRYRATTAATIRKVEARLNEGYTLDDFIKVIDTKAREWQGTERAKYLRPETLFGTKFEGYLNQAPDPEQEKRERGIMNSVFNKMFNGKPWDSLKPEEQKFTTRDYYEWGLTQEQEYLLVHREEIIASFSGKERK